MINVTRSSDSKESKELHGLYRALIQNMVTGVSEGFKKELSSKNLILSYLSHPLMSFKIIGAIHYEALKLWLKGVNLVKRKLKIKNNITFET